MAADSAPHGRLVIGVTGGIGSGKSTAAQLFADYGAALVDTDAGHAPEAVAHDGGAGVEARRPPTASA